MFSLEFLHRVRRHEVEAIVRHLAPGARILEIGGGTGYQAQLLAERGFAVVSLDVAGSNYQQDRVFPVTIYDGKVFPFEEGAFDIVLSSNALEHIADLTQLHRESRRVLKPGGYCVHVMPTAVWRFWTSVTHYWELMQKCAGLLPGLVPRRPTLHGLLSPLRVLVQMARLARDNAMPPRHGETGSAVTELWTFSRRHWLKHFREHGYAVISADPMGLFYTGQMVLGKRWSLASRQRLAAVLGSACILYKVRPSAAGVGAGPA